ncbi:pollen-specific leucine-rich repeat extensin-like protein 4 [Iris pallida]|uniref:Pollen-specific leucine-rich repeat extensin-like protein 4 n=1 Tax=Iris pallida TaxID=29817 RepID=A0AAX6DZ52_IRIPA|nr:pollen-specific leucine-rich repeat extensin-like protein 4 [Iris pallida]
MVLLVSSAKDHRQHLRDRFSKMILLIPSSCSTSAIFLRAARLDLPQFLLPTMAKLASTTTTATATTVAILPLLEIVKASQVARGQGRRRRCTYVCVCCC